MTQSLPFSAAKLDALLDEFGADVLLASSKHNVQYLLGGYRYFFFEHSAAIGLGHYLPVMGYLKGRADLAFYVGGGDESWGIEVFPIWPERVATVSWTARESARVTVDYLRSAGLAAPRIALEFELWPVAAWEILRAEFPSATFIDAAEILEELRSVKTEAELNNLRNAAAGIVDSMLATSIGFGQESQRQKSFDNCGWSKCCADWSLNSPSSPPGRPSGEPRHIARSRNRKSYRWIPEVTFTAISRIWPEWRFSENRRR
jgi:hypothetical protein